MVKTKTKTKGLRNSGLDNDDYDNEDYQEGSELISTIKPEGIEALTHVLSVEG